MMTASPVVNSMLKLNHAYRQVRCVGLEVRASEVVVRWEEWMPVGFLWSSNYQVFTDEARARKKVAELEGRRS